MFKIFKSSKNKFDNDKVVAYAKAPGNSILEVSILAIDKNNNSKFVCYSKDHDSDRLIRELTANLKNKNFDKTNKSVNFKYLNND